MGLNGLFSAGGSLDPDRMPALTLAYIGDAVHDLHVRMKLVGEGNTRTHSLHQQAVGYVSAKNQRQAYERIKNRFTPEESAVAQRGRNAKSGTIPPNADPADYAYATALEAVIGYLFLKGQTQRLETILQIMMEGNDGSGA